MLEIFEKLARPAVLKLKPYDSARSQIGADSDLILLDANENPISAADIMTNRKTNLNRYPDPRAGALLPIFSRLYGVDAASILVTLGSDQGIDLLCRVFCREGVDKILATPPTFGCYKISAELQGCETIAVPLLEDGFQLDVKTIIEKINTENPKIVFLCSPNSPSGNVMKTEDIEAVIKAAADKAIIIVDEAYAEFVDQPSWAKRLDEFPHMAVMRTMSKYYGLAGARCGVMLGHPDLIDLLRRAIAPYPIPSTTIDAVKEALNPKAIAILDQKNRILIEERKRLEELLLQSDEVLKVYPSETNFILFETKNRDAFYNKLKKSGIIVRKYSADNTIRMSVGLKEQNDLLLMALGVLDAPQSQDREATAARKSKETEIVACVNLDQQGHNISTGIGFFDHMLQQLSKHGGFALTLTCTGDLETGDHHTVEDCAIVIGQALAEALGDKRGINRYGSGEIKLAMDEALVHGAVDLSGRAVCSFKGEFKHAYIDSDGTNFATEMVPHFFKTLSDYLGAAIHVDILKGENDHHMVEGCFKAVAKSLGQAIALTGGDELASTKGVFDRAAS